MLRKQRRRPGVDDELVVYQQGEANMAAAVCDLTLAIPGVAHERVTEATEALCDLIERTPSKQFHTASVVVSLLLLLPTSERADVLAHLHWSLRQGAN